LCLPTPVNGTIDGKREISRAYPHWHAAARLELGELLGVDVYHLPAVFGARYPRPLKIGAYQDLAELYPGAELKKIRRWLARWCHSPAYLRALSRGVARYGLDGELAGEIRPIERAHARRELADRRAGKAPAMSTRSSAPSSSRPILRLPGRAAP